MSSVIDYSDKSEFDLFLFLQWFCLRMGLRMKLGVVIGFLAIFSLSCVNRANLGNFNQTEVGDSTLQRENQCAPRSMARTIAAAIAKKGICGALTLYVSTVGVIIADAQEPVGLVRDDFDLTQPCLVSESGTNSALELSEFEALMSNGLNGQVQMTAAPLLCEIPSGAIFPKPSMNYVRARAIRDTMLLVMAAARQVPDRTLSIPADYLFHYLVGSGAPKVIKETEIVETLHRVVLKAWDKKGRPKKTRIEIGYTDYEFDMNSPITNAVGRALVEVVVNDENGTLKLRVNDGYVWPGYKYRGMEGDGIYHPFVGVPPLLAKYLAFLAGPKPENFAQNFVQSSQVSDGLWHQLQKAGAKEYHMVYEGTVKLPDSGSKNDRE